MSAAKDSSQLQKAVGRHQLHRALVELQQEEQEEQEEQEDQDQDQEHEQEHEQHEHDDDFSHKSSTRTSFGSTVPTEGKSNIDGPGEPSSTLRGDDWFVKGVNVSARFMTARRLNMSQQNILHEIDDLLTLNFIFTKAFIGHCFGGGENGLMARLIQIDVPEAPRQEVDLIIKFAIAAASKEYLDFKAILRRSGLELNGLAGDILTTYTATNALWQDRTGLARNEDAYIKQSVMLMIDAFFGSLEFVQHWQRDQLPVPNGYGEVLQPDFFAEVD
ncbi:hypothetical protein BGZ58_009893 [Dissophora ornata]|nr:hypothetical protein BGZ58_009893 [Dissophora ornata]